MNITNKLTNMTGKGARRKGHDYERKVAVELRKMGFEDCETSRYANPKQDSAGVDLIGTDPFHIQCKSVETGINYHRILSEMPQGCNFNAVLHKRARREVVAMSKSGFYEILGMLLTNRII